MSHYRWSYTIGFVFGLLMASLFRLHLTPVQEGVGVFLIILCGNLLSDAIGSGRRRA